MALRTPPGGLKATMSPAVVGDLKLRKKERVLNALTKMNDRDTQRGAAEELLSMVQDMDQEMLPIMISSLCSTGSDQKVYARKECARALGVVASEACPTREQALSQPHLNKMLGQLKKALGDADSSVRDAACEALALVARGLSDVSGGAAAVGNLSNPVVKLLFDLLPEQRKELQVAACVALGLASPYIGQLDSSLVKEIVKRINSPAFQATHALMGAVARCDPATNAPAGLMKSGAGAFAPLLSSLVGQPGASLSTGSAPASGVLACLSHKDWAVRRAAADFLKAAALLYGPLLEPEGCWDPADARCLTARCVRGLDQWGRFDKVKEVRDTAREALAVLEDLQEYGRTGGSSGGWADFIGARTRERGAGMTPAPSPSPALPAAPTPAPLRPVSASRRRSPSPTPRPQPRSPGTAESKQRQSPFARQGSLNERFRKAHADGDVIAEPQSRELNPSRSSSRPASASSLSRQPPPSRMTSQDVPRPASAADRTPLPYQPEMPSQYEGDEDLNITLATSGRSAAADQQQQAPGSTPGPGAGRGPAPGAEQLSSAAGETVTVPLEVWRSMQAQLQEMEERQRKLLAAMASLTDNSNRTITELQGTITELQGRLRSVEGQVSSRGNSPLRNSSITPLFDDVSVSRSMSASQQQQQAPEVSGSRYAYESPRASLHVVRPVSPKPYRTASQEASGLVDINATYAEALRADMSDMHLIRLLQRTGCVWNELAPDTALRLLSTFIAYVQDGVRLEKVVPWLYRLADDKQTGFQVPRDMQQQLVQALDAASTADPQMSGKVSLLSQTLRSHWGLSGDSGPASRVPSAAGLSPLPATWNPSAGPTSGSAQAAAAGVMSPLRSTSPYQHQSLESLDVLKAQLDELQQGWPKRGAVHTQAQY